MVVRSPATSTASTRRPQTAEKRQPSIQIAACTEEVVGAQMTPGRGEGDLAMKEISRRALLTRGSLGAAGAIGVMAMPNVALAAVGSDEPELSEVERRVLAQSFVVHLRDLNTGELELLVGEKSVVFTDKKLVAKVLRAAR